MKNKFGGSKHHEAPDEQIQKILKQWPVVQGKYVRGVRGDLWWQYSERPYIGLLAASIWMLGGIALEEWRISGRPRYGNSYARNDLWVRYGHNDRDMVIEAKHKYLIIRKDSQFDRKINDITKRLDDAFDDAKNVARKDAPNSERIGVLFLCCTFRSIVSQDDAVKMRGRCIEKIKRHAHSGIAWIFDNREIKKGCWTTDGVILLVKKA
jgi:hypothetical protein